MTSNLGLVDTNVPIYAVYPARGTERGAAKHHVQ